jgi:hypothetical protein
MAKDIKIINNDAEINNGDFAIHNSDAQNVQDIVKSYLGHWKENPLLGAGIDLFTGSSGEEQEIKRRIQLHLEDDGFKVNAVRKIDNKNWYIDAERI